MQFIDTAYKLNIYTIKQCVKFPKRYTFYVSQEIAHLSSEIHRKVKSANSIYPTNEHEYQIRRDILMSAYADCQSLISMLNATTELFQIAGNTMSNWMELIATEINLIKGVLKRDKVRCKNLIKSDKCDNESNKN